MLKMNRRQLMLSTVAATAGAAFPSALMAQQNKTLVIGNQGAQSHFDPHAGQDYPTSVLMRNIYDALVDAVGAPPRIVPRVATEWMISEDGLVYTFKLNPNAKFHDGSPLNAEAVKYSFDRIQAIGRGNNWMINGVVGPDTIKIIDDHTVEFTLLQPFAAFLQVLPWISIVNPAVIEANAGSDMGQTYLLNNTAGSGPFTVVRFEPESVIEFRRDPEGWREGGGNTDTIIWRYVRENTNQRLMLQRGEIHMAVDLTSDDVMALEGVPGVKTVVEPGDRTFSIKMNTEHGPTADVNLRKAISYAFDYDEMLRVSGLAELMQGPLPSSFFGHDGNLEVPRRDIEKAKEYLAKTEWPEGGLTLDAVYVTGLEQERLWCLVLLDSLRDLNINVNIIPATWPDMLSMAESPEKFPAFFCVYLGVGYADPDVIAYAGYHSSRNGGWQNPVYKNPAVDALIERARYEPDTDKRAELYAEVQEAIVDDAPDIFGVVEKSKVGLRDNVEGYTFTPIIVQAVDFFPLSLSD
ncbi:MAG: ABC transporter substrate-binding protein [Rhizobiaceae bacterium]|nr:ABC transporter substrate-binding protein [Rhizobiaceae bacterium]